MRQSAEELVEQIKKDCLVDSVGDVGIETFFYTSTAVAFIKAALQAEREACAERAAEWCGVWLSEVEHEGLRAAILNPKEE